MLIKKCLICGNRFKTFFSINSKYCSRKCAGVAMSKRMKGNKINIGRKGTKIHGIAIGKIWSGKKRPDHSKRMKGKNNPMYGKENKWGHHTEEAKQKIREKVSGKNNSNWIDGRKKLDGYPAKFNRELKRKIFERDKFRCQICNTNNDITVHHIDYNKDDCSEENLITLCRSHNCKVNWNRKFWQIYLGLKRKNISVRLNLGCGIVQKLNKEGWINIDILDSVNPDLKMDMTKKGEWLKFFKTNSIDEVRADYILCQVCNKDKFLIIMNMIHRVLKPDGVFELRVPNAEFPEAFRDPMDCRYFTKETFDHFNIEHYRWRVFKYGFKPWYIMSIKKERKTRLLVKMRPYK